MFWRKTQYAFTKLIIIPHSHLEAFLAAEQRVAHKAITRWTGTERKKKTPASTTLQSDAFGEFFSTLEQIHSASARFWQ